MSSSWQPDLAIPMTMFVSSIVHRGERLVFSPVPGERSLEWFPNPLLQSRGDVTLGEAAATSARFPWVTPTARLRVANAGDRILGDGGYFENSGADTVLDVIRIIEQHAARKRLDKELGNEATSPEWTRCQLVIESRFSAEAPWNGCDMHVYFAYFPITSRTEAFVDYGSDNAMPAQSFLLDPIRALLIARERRANIALQRAQERFCGLALCFDSFSSDSGFFEQVLPLDVIDLPLGWYLSNDEAALISSSVPSAKCVRFDENEYRISHAQKVSKLKHLFKDKNKAGESAADQAYEWLRLNACRAETMAHLFNPSQKGDVAYGVEGFDN